MMTEEMKQKQVNRQSTNNGTPSVKGQLSFDDQVVQKIVGYAIQNVEGLLGVDGGFISNMKNKLVNSNDLTEGVNVEVGKEQTAVDLNVVIEFGSDARKIFKEVQEIVGEKIKQTTGLDLVELNVKVVDILTAEEYEDKQVSLQDKVSDASSVIKDKAEDAYGTVKDKAGDAYDTAKDKAGTEYANVKDKVQESRIK